MKAHSDFVHNFTLIVALLLAFLVYFMVKFQPIVQIMIVGGTALFYVLWGVLYHVSRGDLTMSTFLHYLLFGLIGFAAFGAVSFWRLL